MIVQRLNLSSQRREVSQLAQIAASQRAVARSHGEQALSTFEARLKSGETLVLAFVSGLTLAMLVPQGRRGQSEQQRRPITNNAALRQAVVWVRSYTLGRVFKALADLAVP